MAEDSRTAGGTGARALVIGYALAISNRTLGLRVYGSPKEILDALRKRELELLAVVNHRDTAIDAQEVLSPSPRLSFSGGPHAETVLELLEAIQQADIGRAAAILARDGGVISSEPSDAAVVPLLAAVSARHTEMVRLLLQAGTNVDGAGQFGMTALHWASALGEVDLVKLLLGERANARRLTWFFVTAGQLAAINGRATVVREFESRYGPAAVAFSLDQVVSRMKEAANSDAALA